MKAYYNPSRFSNAKEIGRAEAASILIQLKKRLGSPFKTTGSDYKVYRFPHNVFDAATVTVHTPLNRL